MSILEWVFGENGREGNPEIKFETGKKEKKLRTTALNIIRIKNVYKEVFAAFTTSLKIIFLKSIFYTCFVKNSTLAIPPKYFLHQKIEALSFNCFSNEA